MTVYSESVIQDLRKQVEDKDKEIKRLEQIITTQLGLETNDSKQQETDRKRF